MANNVYVGSRYVPLFDGTWSNSKTYEPLTIVEYGNSSYTSKKPVPAGTLPTNTNYWALTGNYNGQISNLQTQINTANNKITALQNIDKRKFLFVGDSYGANPRVTTTWGAEAAAAMGLDSTQWVNRCVDGAKWDATSNNYLAQISGYTGDKSSVTDIVICAGANDINTNFDTILSKMSAFATYVKNNYPYAKVWLGWIGFGTPITGTSGAYAAYEAYKACGYAGFAYMPNLIASNHDYNLLEDNNFHPNNTALKQIGWAVSNYLKGGVYDSEMYTGYSWMAGATGLVIAKANSTINIAGSSYMRFKGDDIAINIGRFLINYTTAINITNDSDIVLAYLDHRYFRPKNGNYPIAGSLQYTTDGSNWHELTGFFTFLYQNGHTELRFHSNSGAVSGVTYAVINVNFEYPLMMC